MQGLWHFNALIVLLVSMETGVEAAKFNRKVDIGGQAPAFDNLQGTDLKKHSLDDYKKSKVLVVAFICNHCPVAQAYESRLKNLVETYQAKGVSLVAINCSRFSADSFEKMKARAKKQNFNFDYLDDPSQTTGKKYGATVTPHLFVLDKDRKIAYMGAFDDNMNAKKVEEHYVIDAVDALLAGQEIDVTESRQFGCALLFD